MDELCRIRELQRAVLRFESAFEEHYGITLNEAMTLCTLSKEACIRSGQLGDRLGLTPSNTSKVLRAAEAKGLVERRLCCEDRRQMYYALTPAGRSLLAAIDCRMPDLPETLRRWLDTP